MLNVCAPAGSSRREDGRRGRSESEVHRLRFWHETEIGDMGLGENRYHAGVVWRIDIGDDMGIEMGPPHFQTQVA
jgi:hypothetical protein